MDELCEIRITADDAEWLATFAKRLVEERLCVCGQISAPIHSIYRWEGAVCDETEARVSLHTRRSLVPAVIELVEKHHPYEIPGVLVLPISDGAPAYLQWVLDETAEPK